MALPSVPLGYSNWNAYLNDLPKSQRGMAKCDVIAEPIRQAVGTPGYRILNNYVGTVSPEVGHPWAASPLLGINLVVESGGDILETESGVPLILG